MTQNIVVNIEEKGAAATAQGIDKVTTADKALEEQNRQTNEELKAREKLLGDAANGLTTYITKLNETKKAAAGAFGGKALKDFETTAIKAFKSLIAGAKDGSKSIQGFNAEVKLFTTGALADAGISMHEFATALQEAGSSYDEFTNSIASGVMDEFSGKFEKVEGKTKSLKSQLKTLKEELSRMESAGLDGTEAFDKMAIEAGKLEDQIGDTAERVRVLSSDTANLDAAVEAVRAVAAGFQLASGAAALFGASEEDMQKVLVKLNAVMAITQSLQEVQNFLRGQSILKIKLEAAQNAILATSTRVTTTAFAAFGVSVEATSFAFKALRAAIITTGIGALVVAIGFVINKLMDWTDKTKDQEAAQKRLNDEIANSDRMLNDNMKEIDRVTQRKILNKRLEGASNTALLKAEEEGRNKQIEELIDHMNRTANLEISANLSKEQRDAEVLRREESNAADQEKIRDLQFENEKARMELHIQQQEDALKEEEQNAAEAQQKKEQRDKEAAAHAEEMRKREKQAVIDFETWKSNNAIEASLEIANNASLNEEVRTNASKDATANQLALAKYETETLLLNQELTATERELIEAQHHKKIHDINAEAAKRLYKIWRDNNQQIVDLKKAPDLEEVTYEQANALLKIVDDSKKEEVKVFDEAEKKKQELRNQAKQAAFNAAKETADLLFELGNENRAREQEKQLEALGVAKDAELNNKNLTEQQKDDINKKYALKERQLKIKAFEEEKKAKRAQAIINGLLGVTQAFATSPWPASIIFAAAVAATAALAVAKISSTQPGFKKGGYTGDKGKDEIAGYVHGREWVATAEATQRYKPALEAINQLKFDEYLAKIAPRPRSITPLPAWASSTSGGSIDYDRLGQSVANHTKAPSMIMNFDENGASAFLIEKNRQVLIKNSRYKL